MLNKIREIRFNFFKEVSKKRWKRITLITFCIATIWIIIDVLKGQYEPLLMDDLLCVIFAIILERILPWGKRSAREDRLLEQNKILRDKNKALSNGIKESTDFLNNIYENFQLIKK